jgi:oxidoreductase
LGHFTSSLGIEIDHLGKAVGLAGKLGTKDLPEKAHATTVQTEGGNKFTLINNAGAVYLSKVSDL